MEPTPSHAFSEETPEAKARWFQSLSMTERMELLCLFTDLMLEINPAIRNHTDDQSANRHILTLGTP